MAVATQAVVDQIDDVLHPYEELRSQSKYDDLSDLTRAPARVVGAAKIEEMHTRMVAALQRLSPPSSAYVSNLPRSQGLGELAGTLRALRADYQAGYLQTVEEFIHASMFADFLEQADYLLAEEFKDPAAVLAGGVLEEHLRKLCDRSTIKTQMPNGKPKKASVLNDELTKAGVYNKLEQKSVTAWLDLRNNAAHGEYDHYDKNQVANMIQGVRDFITRNPA